MRHRPRARSVRPSGPAQAPTPDPPAGTLSVWVAGVASTTDEPVRRRHLRRHELRRRHTRRVHAAAQIVVTTGPFQVPFVPPIAARLGQEVFQLHSTRYRSLEDLPDGPALVMGGGNTGFQVAEDLSATREVHLSIGSRQTSLPQRTLGRDASLPSARRDGSTSSAASLARSSSPIQQWLSAVADCSSRGSQARRLAGSGLAPALRGLALARDSASGVNELAGPPPRPPCYAAPPIQRAVQQLCVRSGAAPLWCAWRTSQSPRYRAKRELCRNVLGVRRPSNHEI